MLQIVCMNQKSKRIKHKLVPESHTKQKIPNIIGLIDESSKNSNVINKTAAAEQKYKPSKKSVIILPYTEQPLPNLDKTMTLEERMKQINAQIDAKY